MRHALPRPGGDGLWVFGYGSLMWEPGFAFARAEAAVVAGWHRRMSMVATTSYGAPAARPGLAAGLHPGGTVTGIAFLLPPEGLDEALARLSWRERHYLSVMVPARLVSGARVRALTFAAHGTNGRFRAAQPRGDFLRRLAAGRGTKGHAAEYVRKSAAALSEYGVRTSDLHALTARLAQAQALRPPRARATPRRGPVFRRQVPAQRGGRQS